MSKSNETSNLERHDTLADSELETVTGGKKYGAGSSSNGPDYN